MIEENMPRVNAKDYALPLTHEQEKEACRFSMVQAELDVYCILESESTNSRANRRLAYRLALFIGRSFLTIAQAYKDAAADRDKWRDRCERLVKALDIAGKRCQDVHHSAKHRHGDDEDCLAAQSIYEAIQLYHDAVCESVDRQIQKEIDDDTTRTS